MSEEVKALSGVLIPSEGMGSLSPASPGDKPGAKKEANDFPFAVAVGDVYEGPLDLLLDLIRKQDIDIYDIPIARITAQYLTYVERMRELDVNIAADFIYMAAVLIHIKSKMLLPRDPLAPADTMEDPRGELVNRLLEHEKFKSAAQMLLQKQQIEDAIWSNPALKEFKDAEGTEPELAADVIDLVKTFQQILDRARSRPILERPGAQQPLAHPAHGRDAARREVRRARVVEQLRQGRGHEHRRVAHRGALHDPLAHARPRVRRPPPTPRVQRRAA